jgi:hypothetical protein
MTLGSKKNTINYTVDVKIAQRREFNVVFFQGILQETSRILHTASAGRLRFGLIEERTRGRIYSKFYCDIESDFLFSCGSVHALTFGQTPSQISNSLSLVPKEK